MNPFRRMEILSNDLVQHLTEQQNNAQFDEAAESVAELLQADPAQNKKELFLVLVRQALCAMALYVDELQAEEGRRILEQVAQGKEPPPVFHHIVHPCSNVFQRWKAFQETVNGPEMKFAASTPFARQIFYAGAAGMYSIFADKWSEVGAPSGTVLLEDLETELANFASSIERAL